MRSLSVWTRDPFAREFDALVRGALGADGRPFTRAGAFAPAAETLRDGDDAVVRVELPGVDLENDVTVEVEHGQLVVRGERKDEHEENTNGRALRELRYGSFRRSFVLPSHVTADAVSASYDKGILTVRVAGAYKDDSAKRIAITGA
jgi:HSP20 family molecular chaperone IbpA